MTLRRKRVRRRLSIASLIDVIFLLLLFFMLASTFSKFSEIEVAGAALADAGEGGASEASILRVDPHRLSLNGTPIDEADLARSVRLAKPMPAQLQLHVSAQVSTQRLTDILVQLQPVDGLKVNMVGPS